MKKENILEKRFRERLKSLRKEKDLFQKDIAEKIGVALSTYSNWEQGRTQPSIQDIYKLLMAFEIEADELFELDKEYELR